jgi:L-lactate dehydrogenase complex protein LldF
MAEASSHFGACAEVCPVRIPIPSLLNRLRFEAVQGAEGSAVSGRAARRKPLQARIWGFWSWACERPARYRALGRLASLFRGLQPRRLGPWTRTREPPRIAPKSLHRLAKENGFDGEA